MQVNIPLVPAFIFGTAIFFVVAANMVFYSILGEVNGKRPPNEQISMFFVNVRASKIIRMHRQFYPVSQKRKAMWALAIAGFFTALVAYIVYITDIGAWPKF